MHVFPTENSVKSKAFQNHIQNKRACHIKRAIMKVEVGRVLVDLDGDGKQGIYFAWPNYGLGGFMWRDHVGAGAEVQNTLGQTMIIY